MRGRIPLFGKDDRIYRAELFRIGHLPLSHQGAIFKEFPVCSDRKKSHETVFAKAIKSSARSAYVRVRGVCFIFSTKPAYVPSFAICTILSAISFSSSGSTK